MSFRARALVGGFLVFAAWFAACSSSSSVAITISPTTATVSIGGTQSFSATVTGSSNTAVTWAVTEASGGTITSAGVYTAPSAAGTFHVVATSAADTSKSATAVVTVTTAQAVSVAIQPTTATLNPSGTQQFGATVSGSSNMSVTWSVQEGASGGTVTVAGFYTAPTALGTYHVVATSVADTTKSATAVVTVQSAPVVTVTVNPPTADLGPAETQQFAATVTGTTNTAVAWTVQEGADGGSVSSGGLYTAPGSAGTFHVIATSNADMTKTGTSTITVNALPTGNTVSGTVSYAGAATGRIYVGLYSTNCNQCNPWAGTSLAAPGPYRIRVGQAAGTFTIMAFVDVAGIQAFQPTADPSGTTAQFTLSGTSVSGKNLALADPTPSTPTAPGMPSGFFSNDAVVMGWQAPSTAIDHAKVYSVPPDGGVCPSNASTTGWGTAKSVPISPNGGGPQAIVHGLVQNADYCFAVSGMAGGTEGPLSPAWGPVQVVAPTGNHNVSGVISFSPLTPTGPLYVAVVQNPMGNSPTIYITDFANPVSPQAYTVTGVPAGSYNLYAFIDMANAGAFVPGLVGNTNTQYPPMVTVATTDVDAGQIVLPVADVRTSVLTQTQIGGLNDGGTGNVYNVQLEVQSDVNLPVLVTVTGGPNLGSVLDIGLSTNSGGNTSQFQANIGLNGTTPLVGDTYSFTVTLANGITEPTGATVSGVVPGVVTLTTPPPNGTSSSDVPTFMWTVPASLGGSPNYVQQLTVNPGGGGNTLWNVRGLTLSQNSVVYDYDGTATQMSLSPMTPYAWGVTVSDTNGNTSQAYSQFTSF